LSALAGVFGYPVAHSRSPAMMAAAFDELGLDWRYFRLPVPPGLFPETARALGGSGYVGANVTIPHKLAALELADTATSAARAVGAANTLTFTGGRIEADNTDAAGILDALGQPVPGRALVLGAGGAGRAAVWALKEAGADVAVWNRTESTAAELAGEMGVRRVEEPEPAELVINATPVGMGGEQNTAARLGLAGLEPPGVLVDLVYGNEPTALARWAAARGARVVDGREVLVRQGARSLERWTGDSAPVATMRAALERSV
jgi:shikimate dehydrogenase